MIKTHPQRIYGSWDAGWALDLHTLSSVPLGPDGSGRELFDTTRTELGEALYQLKYRDNRLRLTPIADIAAAFLSSLQIPNQEPLHQFVSSIIPVPPSLQRRFQPVPEVATLIGQALGIPVPLDYLLKIRSTTALKGMADTAERRTELTGAFTVADSRFAGKRVILVDDLFRSGDTMNAITETLKQQGQVTNVYVLAITRTRSNR